jgi:predicted N-acyltransferase
MNYRTQVLEEWRGLGSEDVDSLCTLSASNPFVNPHWLKAMESSGSASPGTGWTARPVLVRNEDSRLVAAAPLYFKQHSYGEYVFDWAWARAAQSAGIRYYPKGLIASPFSPVPGPRLLAEDHSAREALARALTTLSQDAELSSAHLLFGELRDHEALERAGWLTRLGVQFHWQNRGYRDFEDFLDSLTQPRRKKIRAERRKVREAGVVCEVKRADEITDSDWSFFYRCYCQTYLEHGNPPYLSEAFFQALRQTMPEHLALVIASASISAPNHPEPIASALIMLGEEGRVAYGRYWGATAHLPCLHFEVAYYTPIEWAIAAGVQRIEGGAQGEHKLWRGFEPVETRSSHWVSDPRFREAVGHFLAREGQGVQQYLSELDDHSPFRDSA